MNTFKKLILVLLALPVLLTGCDQKFDDINKNPNQTISVPSPFIMSYAQRELGYYLYDVWRSGRQSTVAAQHWGQINYTDEDRYLFRQEVTDGFFRQTYIILQSFQDIINLNTNEATKGSMLAFGDNEMQIATATLMKIWAIELLAETFGDVPYTDALQPATIVQPSYDTQATLLPKLLTDATAAVNALKQSDLGWTQGDVIFGGDLDKWIKFGNSLKLRLVVRMSNVRNTWQTEAQAIIADGVMEDLSDNARIKFVGAGAPNEAPLYNGFVVSARNDFSMTKQFANLLKGFNDTDKGYTNPFFGLEDPRFIVYIGAANYNAGKKNGIPYGMTDAQTGAYVNANSATFINLKSNPLPLVITADYWSTFLDYPTVCFLKSEAYGWNAQYFEDGIRASLEQWGADVDEEYIADVMTIFNGANTEKKKEIVMTQKYIHLYTQSFEAWAEYRRTGYPGSLVKPGQITNGTIVFTPSNETGGIVVPRLKYDTNEYTLNKENVEAAATSIGGDAYTTKLWWAKQN